MAKVLILVCLLLVVTLSRSAPILDEEVDNDFDEDDDTQNESESERSDENDDDNYNDANARDDDDYADEGDLKRKEDDDSDEEEYKDGEDREVEISEERAGGDTQELDDDDDDDMRDSDARSNDQTVDAAAKRVVEDFEGNLALEKNSNQPSLDEDDDVEDEEGGDDSNDMGNQISKLKKIFNQDMPKEIDELKSNSKTLRDNLDNLNAKLDNFLRENGIKQDPAIPQSDAEHNYAYN